MKVISIVVGIAVALSIPMFASLAEVTREVVAPVEAQVVKGVITAWNEVGRELSVEDADGKSWSITWDEKTVIVGSPASGSSVTVECVLTDDRALKATKIVVIEE